MSEDPKFCRERALDCAKRALYAADRRERKALTQASQVWLKLALEIETRAYRSTRDASGSGRLTDAA